MIPKSHSLGMWALLKRCTSTGQIRAEGVPMQTSESTFRGEWAWVWDVLAGTRIREYKPNMEYVQYLSGVLRMVAERAALRVPCQSILMGCCVR